MPGEGVEALLIGALRQRIWRCRVWIGMAQVEVGAQRFSRHEASLHTGAQVVPGRLEANTLLAFPPLVKKVLALLVLQGLFLRGAQMQFLCAGRWLPELCLLVFHMPPGRLAIREFMPGAAIPAQTLYGAEPDGERCGVAGWEEVTGRARPRVAQHPSALLIEADEQDVAQVSQQLLRRRWGFQQQAGPGERLALYGSKQRGIGLRMDQQGAFFFAGGQLGAVEQTNRIRGFPDLVKLRQQMLRTLQQ